VATALLRRVTVSSQPALSEVVPNRRGKSGKQRHDQRLHQGNCRAAAGGVVAVSEVPRIDCHGHPSLDRVADGQVERASAAGA
jgi:hypothetical protein